MHKVTCKNCKNTEYHYRCTDWSQSRCNICNSNSFGLKKDEYINIVELTENALMAMVTYLKKDNKEVKKHLQKYILENVQLKTDNELLESKIYYGY